MEREYTFWVEGGYCLDKYKSFDEAVKAAQEAYDSNDEDIIDKETEHEVNIGIVEYFDTKNCAENILCDIKDNGYHKKRCVERVNDALYDLCPDAEWSADRNDVADGALDLATDDWKMHKDDSVYLYHIEEWVKAVIPDVWSAMPLKGYYDCKNRIWKEE